jgi:phosphoribosylamine--glycine ligase
MNVLVIGSGGREHALVWKLAQSPRVNRIYCTPGNPGIAALALPFPAESGDFPRLIAEARRLEIGLTVVGPEGPLEAGIVDAFREAGLGIFGPTRRAAELEWSKAFAKDFMNRHSIPSAAYRTFGTEEVPGSRPGSKLGNRDDARNYILSHPLPLVIKADGLAAGKGVIVCQSRDEAARALEEISDPSSFGNAGRTVVVEEFMEGEEASVFAVTDGAHFVTLAPAQDHKRVFDGDRGKNTGGMGAYAPAPRVTAPLLADIGAKIIGPTLRGMADEGRPYSGCLYAGLMLTAEGPKVVEYNCRFGDPETQVVLPLYKGDLAELLMASASGNVKAPAIPAPTQGSAVCVVLASGGYPGTYETGKTITAPGKDETPRGIVLFHGGTGRGPGGSLVSTGGRVIGVTAVRREGGMAETIAAAYDAVGRISFEGMHFRRDIGARAAAKPVTT